MASRLDKMKPGKLHLQRPISATNYFDFVLANSNGFLGRGGWSEIEGPTNVYFQANADRVSNIPGFSADALQYLGTFSRDSNLATWGPTATDASP